MMKSVSSAYTEVYLLLDLAVPPWVGRHGVLSSTSVLETVMEQKKWKMTARKREGGLKTMTDVEKVSHESQI